MTAHQQQEQTIKLLYFCSFEDRLAQKKFSDVGHWDNMNFFQLAAYSDQRLRQKFYVW